MKKRITAILLTFAMVVTAVPTTAFVSAEELEVVETITPDEAMVEEAAPAEVVAEPEAPAEDAVIVEDAVVVEPEAPAAVAEDDLDIVEEVVEDGAAEEVAADATSYECKLDANLKITVKFGCGTDAASDDASWPWTGDEFEASGYACNVTWDSAYFETYSKEKALSGGMRPEVVSITWNDGTQTYTLDKNMYTVTYKNCTSAGKWNDSTNPPTLVIGWNHDLTQVRYLHDISLKYTIAPKNLDSPDITVSFGGKSESEIKPLVYTYNGQPQRPEVTVKEGQRELEYGTDYYLTVEKETEPGIFDPMIDDKSIDPGTYRLYVTNDDTRGHSAKNYTGAFNGTGWDVEWTIERAEFNSTNISTPQIVLYEDSYAGENGHPVEQVTLQDAYNEIRKRVYDMLANVPWEAKKYVDRNDADHDPAGTGDRSSKHEYDVFVYKVDQKTGKPEETSLSIPGDPLNSDYDGYKYEYEIRLSEGTNTKSTYFKKSVKGTGSLWGELWVVKGKAPLSTIIENRKADIEKALKEKNVAYDGHDWKSQIPDLLGEAIQTYTGIKYNGKSSLPGDPAIEIKTTEKEVVNAGTYTFTISGTKGSRWENEKYDYTVTVGRRQMADNRSAGQYTVFLENFSTTAKQYVHSDKSAGATIVTVTDKTWNNGKGLTLTAGKDFELRKESDGWNNFVYITGINNYKTTRGTNDVPVEIKLAVDQTDLIYLGPKDADTVHCEIVNVDTEYKGPTKPVEVGYSNVVVYEEINGKRYDIPSDCWTISEFDCSDNKHWAQGAHTVTVKGRESKGYAGEVKGSFSIGGFPVEDDFEAHFPEEPIQLTDKEIAWKDLGIIVNARVVHTEDIEWWNHFNVKVEYTDWEGKTYTPTYDTSKDSGITFVNAVEHTVTLIPKRDDPLTGGYENELTGTIMVRPRDFTEWSLQNSKNRIQVSNETVTIEWPGRQVDETDFSRVGITVTDAQRKKSLKLGTEADPKADYTVVRTSGGTKAGDDVVYTLAGIHDYAGEFPVTVKVVKRDLSKIENGWLQIDDQQYWGGADASVPKDSIGEELYVYLEDPRDAAKDGRTALRMPASDYEVKCDDASAAGKWAVGDQVRVGIIPTDTENYTGKCEKTTVFEITKANIGDQKIFAVDGVPTVTAGEDPARENVGVTDTRNGYPLTSAEYTVEFRKGVGAGEGTLVLNGAGKNYTGTRSVTVKRTLDGGSITAAAATYDGTPQTPKVTVKDAAGNVVNEEDYEVSYSNNVDAGTANVKVVVKDSSEGYTGALEGTFTIAKAPNSGVSVTPKDITVAPDEKKLITVSTSVPKEELTYASSNPAVAIVDKDGNVTGVTAGSAVVTVTAGVKNYETATATVNVTVVVEQATVITAVSKRAVWTGAAQTIDLGAKASSGAALTYAVTDASNSKGGISIVDGKAVVTGDFMGEAVVTISAPAKGEYKAAATKISVKVSPKDIQVTKATSKNGKIVVKYSTTASATKYQLQIADNASFKNARTIKSKMWGDPNKRTIKTKIKKGNTYYVRVRACNKIGKVLFHSTNWSKAVAVKVR